MPSGPLLIVADDLTGALDSAAPFALRGARTWVARRPEALAELMSRTGPHAGTEVPEVIAVSTASREGSAAAAVAAVTAVADWARKAGVARVFKKVDSRLKGHPGAETAALAAPGQPVLLCPAIPAQGRLTRAGRALGTGIAEPIDMAARMAGLANPLLLPDTEDDAAIDAALARAPEGALLVGAAGLAAALARALLPVPRPVPDAAAPAGPVLFAIGSRDPITLAQVAELRARAAPQFIAAPNGTAAPGARLGPLTLVQMLPGAPIDGATAGAAFAATLAGLCDPAPALLLCAGGETADAVLARLGGAVIRLLGERLPGLPEGEVILAGRPMRLITKSGGFGTADCLARIALSQTGPAQTRPESVPESLPEPLPIPGAAR